MMKGEAFDPIETRRLRMTLTKRSFSSGEQ